MILRNLKFFCQLTLPRFGHSMVSGLFEPIGHKKWPLKFHFHDFEEFVLGDDGRAYQNELRVLFPSYTSYIYIYTSYTGLFHFDLRAASKVVFVDFFVVIVGIVIFIVIDVESLSLSGYGRPAVPTS